MSCQIVVLQYNGQMRAENKQNSVPNTQHSIFSNPLINQKIISTQPSTPPQSTPHCKTHQKPLSHLFCCECLTYNICRSCISSTHFQHQVMQFTTHDQLITETKEILLQSLEETLKDLKRKENQVKNRTHQISLVRNSLRTLQQDIVNVISGIFKGIQTKLLGSIENQQQKFSAEVEVFFKDFNQLNDQLRDNLMNILDSNINLTQFSKQMIKRSPPSQPNFNTYKNTLQKYKKLFKDVKIDLQKAKQTLQKGYNNLNDQNSNNKNNGNNNNALTKLDKYIEGFSSYKGDKVNQSFMKTLRLLEMGDKENYGYANYQSKGKGNGGKKVV